MVENREFVDNLEARAAEDAGRDVIAEQITTRSDVVEGMEARNADGQFVGGVREVRATHFLLDRPMARDAWVPFSAVADIVDGLVMLNVTDIDDKGWEKPSLVGKSVV